MMEIIARHYRSGNPWLVSIRDNMVERVAPVDAPATGGLILAPALFDIQVNGFAGVDFNARRLRPADMLAGTRALARHGVARFLPAVITGPLDRMQANLATIAAAVKLYPEVERAVRGIHLEGPYISAREGARGIHDPHWVHPPDEAEYRALQESASGMISLITLAPELDGAIGFIRRRVAEGAVIAIGHTIASREAIRDAIDAGARLSTHLGNGSEAMLPRHENYVTIQLGDDDLLASFIADGYHLPAHLLKSFIRAKGMDRSILTTDCMAAAGAPPGRYTIAEMEVEVGRDGVVRQPGRSNFAGSALTLDRAVANTAQWCTVPLADAIDMASSHPARLFVQDCVFNPDPHSDFILMSDASPFEVKMTVCAGYRRADRL